MKTIATPLSALDVIYSRRSVRAYTAETVPESTVRALIDAAVQAPTAVGAESWSFVVVQDPQRLARLCGAAADALNSAEMRLELAIPSSLTAVAPIIVGVPAQPRRRSIGASRTSLRGS